MKTKIILAVSAGLLAIAAAKHHHSSTKTCPLKAVFSNEVKK